MNKTKFKVGEIDWKEMSAIGISRKFLEDCGAMDAFLRGDETKALSLDLVLLGNELNVDATLQVVKKGDSPIVNIVCINKGEDAEVEMC